MQVYTPSYFCEGRLENLQRNEKMLRTCSEEKELEQRKNVFPRWWERVLLTVKKPHFNRHISL